VVAETAIDPPAFAACAPEVKQFAIARIHVRTMLNCMDKRPSQPPNVGATRSAQMPNTFLELPNMFPGPMQLLVVLFIILLLFGGAKVPSLMRNLGRGANEFKKGLSDADDGGEDKVIEDKRS